MKKIITFILIGVMLYSCSNDDNITEQNPVKEDTQISVSDKQILMDTFGKALSAIVANSTEIRSLLKKSSLQQFDKNYDILWDDIKDEVIDNKSLREIMSDHISTKLLDKIEKNIPYLNIYFPEINILDISPKKYDPKDSELPIIVPNKDNNKLYFNGVLADTLPKGEAPGFNALIINENSRVIINNSNTRTVNTPKYSFKSPEYNGLKYITRNINSSNVGNKAIEAFKYFNRDDNSIYSMALQRDYIYYGITPSNQSGSLNFNTSEYISFIEVNPKAYFKIADQTNSNSNSDDPYIKSNSVSRKKRDFTEKELIDALWTKGTYDIRVEIGKSTEGIPHIIYIPVRPEEIWNFNLDKSRRHHTMFRRSKYTYKIDANNFTAKRYELKPYQLSLGKWNIAEESIYRYITFIEEDESIETNYTFTYDVTKINSSKFNGDIKLELGLGKLKAGEISTEVTNSNTKKETRTITIRRKESSDNLGSIKIYFYDPIVVKKLTDNTYQMKTYDTGYIKFGITAY